MRRRGWLGGMAAVAACAPVRGRRGEGRGPEEEAAVAEEEAALRARVAGRGWAVASAAPFVVTGDLPAAAIVGCARGVIAPAVALLRGEVIDRGPGAPVRVWLFADERSYRGHALALFGERPTTAFGYYAAARGDVVVNYATGDGTVVHELVHPLLRASFPGAPPWLDEGLAALYEHAEAREGRLRGLPNWRLPELQAALGRGAAPSFEAVARSEAAAFYGASAGVSYAVARYLLLYVQERGALARLVAAARAGVGVDASGYAALVEVAAELGFAEIGALRRSWEGFVLGLRYP